jgi:Flp pilus assembly protein TadD
VAKQLVRAEPEAGIALLVLYGRLHDEYQARRSLVAKAHAARQVEAMALLVGHRGSPPLRALAAATAAILATDLDRMGSTSAAERIFRRVLLVDPMCPTALSGMAAITERTGRYGDTAVLLDRLVSVQPGNAEARLRLAVNLERRGVSGRAAEELRACVGPGSPLWVRAVAYQELLHSLVASRRFREARAVLDEAGSALPGDRGIAILRVLVLENTGDRAAATALVAKLGNAEIEEASPRFRYCQPPENEAAAARAEVAAMMPRALEALVRGVAARRPEQHE